ncbi:AaceriAGL189Cp [[Ashbya] aceris (nom. inval.)]|nr:AaceriAGL189Cp [[Ashbya] aceris (nom. inval.)]
MGTPALPPKPGVAGGGPMAEVRLPRKAHLLSTAELQELVRAQDKLQLYVAGLCESEETQQQVEELRGGVAEVREAFAGLEGERRRAQERLDEYHRLVFRYHEAWQAVDGVCRERYDDGALRARLQGEMRAAEAESRALEARLGEIEVDAFLAQYLRLRTEYHVRREKLETWEVQGALRR